MTKTRKEIIIVGLMLLLVIALIGVSYAAFRFTGVGQRENTITTGSITMSYTESSNTISLTGALPTTDETGMKRLNPGEYFDFTVSGKISGDVNINYEITAKDVTTSERKIDGSNIKLYLTRLTSDGTEEQVMSPETYNEETNANNFTGRPAGEMSLYTSSMSSSESNTYRLRMYVDEDYNPQGDGGGLQFSVQVNVYGRDRVAEEVSTVLLNNISEENQYDDGVDTFITGEDPNNYIWYSGKLWRAVSVNNEAKTTKLVTQWNISAITYNPINQTAFEGSYMEDWLNDTSVDGFLGNLRDCENFIVTDAKWNATTDSTSLGSITRPSDSGTIVTDAVGLLNTYEYQTSYTGTTYGNGYLNNGLYWWTLTPYNTSLVRNVNNNGADIASPVSAKGVRPSINLKSNVKIVDGNGTIDNPYRLEGDNDTNLSGTLLSSRYSGEYIRFGNDENNLYRIVSHENGTGTKITSAEPLKNSGAFITSVFDSNRNENYSNTTTIGTFLNGEYLTSYVDNTYSDMIENSTIWYLGTVDGNGSSYKLAKYTDINMTGYATSTESKVGLLRFGELMAGQFERNTVKGGSSSTGLTTNYWTLTPYLSSFVRAVINNGDSIGWQAYVYSLGIRPSLNLKSNVIITGGDGTKNNPFTLKLG